MATEPPLECFEEDDRSSVEKLKSVVATGGIPLSDLADEIEAVKTLIGSGGALLRVAVQPWGAEFTLVAAPTSTRAK